MKPRLSRADIENLLIQKGVTDKVVLVGIRGYYLDSMGKKGANDRNVYDDAIFVISPTEFESFQANTDPSINRKGVATMKTGVHRYHKGKHRNSYWALRLVGDRVPVTRDGQGDSVGIALNIHKGGRRKTGSLGCQTLMPEDWDDFIELVYDQMDNYGQDTIPYVLVEEVERRAQPFSVAQPTFQPQSFVSAPNVPPPAPPSVSLMGDSFAPSANQQQAMMQAQPENEQPPQNGSSDPATGMRPTDDPIQVSTGSKKTLWATILGTLMGGVGMVKGFFSDNLLLIIVGIVCATLIILALIFRTVIMDYARLQLFGDPNKYNAK